MLSDPRRIWTENFIFELPEGLAPMKLLSEGTKTMVPHILTLKYECEELPIWILRSIHIAGHGGKLPTTMGRFIRIDELAETHPEIAEAIRQHANDFTQSKLED